MSPGRRPSSTSVAQPVRDQPRLRAPPRLGGEARQAEVGVVPAARVGDQELDRRIGGHRVGVEEPQRAVGGDRAGHQRRERRAELGRERAVEHVEQLLARAEVARQPPHAGLAEPRPALAEDRHVGVAEAVDRLELVADREQVVALERLEHVELEPVRVLELVDHDQLEPLGPRGAGGGVGEQVAHPQLEVGEVDRGAGGLGGVERAAEAVEQVVEQDQRGAGVMAGAGACGRPPTPRGRRRTRRARAPWRR